MTDDSLLGPPLEITVATVSSSGTLWQETRLVKSALLYADQVVLASVTASLVGGMMQLRDSGDDVMRDATLKTFAAMGENADTLEAIRRLERKRHKSPDEIITLQKWRRHLERASSEFAAGIAQVVDSAAPDELDLAARHGLLTLEPLGLDEENASVELTIERLVQVLAATVGETSTTYPMLDDSTSGLMRAMIAEGMIASPRLEPARQVSVAGDFIRALEAFPDAPMDVVLDARNALRRPLGRFRSAVIEIASSVEVSPFDPVFHERAKDLYRQHVVPALMELEELSREIKVTEALRAEAASGTGVKPAVVAALGIGMTAVTQIPGLAGLAVAATAAAGGVATGAIDIAVGAMKRRQEVASQRDRNKFLFLFETQRRLSGSQ